MAARVVTRLSKYSSITPTLTKLHWLPVVYRILFKVFMLTFKAMYDMAPNYLKTLMQSYMHSRSLRSETGNLLIMPKARRKLGCHSLAYAASKLWNKLHDNHHLPCIIQIIFKQTHKLPTTALANIKLALHQVLICTFCKILQALLYETMKQYVFLVVFSIYADTFSLVKYVFPSLVGFWPNALGLFTNTHYSAKHIC